MIDTEILDGFKQESLGLLAELKSDLDNQTFGGYAQKIDRIMGAAKTIQMESPDHVGLQRIGVLAELCKYIGQKASGQPDPRLVPILVSFFSDVIGVIEELLGALEDPTKVATITQDFSPILIRRLEWLKKKFVSDAGKNQASHAEIEALLASILK